MRQKQGGTKQSNLDIALKIAKEEFARRDPKEMAEKAGGECKTTVPSNSLISLRLLGQEYTLVHPDGEIESTYHHKTGLVAHVLLLHYLLHASGKSLNDELVSYKDIPGGDKYFSVFKKRVEVPLLNAYGENPEGFGKACLGIGGERVDMGDISFRFQAFPKVFITYIFWKGDEEFPASLQVLFDSSVSSYLPLEDIVFLSEMLSWKIVRHKAA